MSIIDQLNFRISKRHHDAQCEQVRAMMIEELEQENRSLQSEFGLCERQNGHEAKLSRIADRLRIITAQIAQLRAHKF